MKRFSSKCFSYFSFIWIVIRTWALEWDKFEFWHLLAVWIYVSHSVQFSHSVMSDSLRPHESQHARLPCPSPTPGACSNSCPSNQWCHPTISFSVIPFSCLQSFPASGSFPVSLFFTTGGQTTGASASVFPMNIQDWFPLGSTRFDLLAVQGTLKSLF